MLAHDRAAASLRRYVRPTAVAYEHGQVVRIDIVVAVEPGVVTGRVVLGNVWTGQAYLKVTEVLLVDVIIMVKIAGNLQQTPFRIDG
jgi:hypothetical protein